MKALGQKAVQAIADRRDEEQQQRERVVARAIDATIGHISAMRSRQIRFGRWRTRVRFSARGLTARSGIARASTVSAPLDRCALQPLARQARAAAARSLPRAFRLQRQLSPLHRADRDLADARGGVHRCQHVHETRPDRSRRRCGSRTARPAPVDRARRARQRIGRVIDRQLRPADPLATGIRRRAVSTAACPAARAAQRHQRRTGAGAARRIQQVGGRGCTSAGRGGSGRGGGGAGSAGRRRCGCSRTGQGIGRRRS